MLPAHKSPSDKSIDVYVVILVPPFILNHTFHATVILPFHVAISFILPLEKLACPRVFANLPPIPPTEDSITKLSLNNKVIFLSWLTRSSHINYQYHCCYFQSLLNEVEVS